MKVVAKIAETFGVKTAQLFAEPTVQVQLLAYRKCASLPKRDENMVEGMVSQALEERIALQEKVGEAFPLNLPPQKYKVTSLDDAEQASIELRNFWKLGTSPISSVVGLLEDQFIHVFTIATSSEKFDGISANATDDSGAVVAVAVVSREGVPGERQRFSLMHEVGHLVLDVVEELGRRKNCSPICRRFSRSGGTIDDEKLVNTGPPCNLKSFSCSSDASVSAPRLWRSACVTSVSSMTQATSGSASSSITTGCGEIEPEPLPHEEPQWLKRTALRAFSEGLITAGEAGRLTGESYESEHKDIIDRRAFMKLSAAERSKVLRDQAEHLKEHYGTMNNLGGGDFLDY